MSRVLKIWSSFSHLSSKIPKWIFKEVGWGGMDRIDLAQERDRWWTLVNAVMNFQAP